MTNLERNVMQIVEPVINSLGYSLYDVIYEKEGRDNYLRIFIDKDGTIDLNDCENVNNAITDILDEKDLIKNQYMLEVSSPGIERRIRSDKQLKESINKLVEIHTYNKIDMQKQTEKDEIQSGNLLSKKKQMKKIIGNNDNKTLQGTLSSFDDNTITIIANDEKIKINKKDISNMKTVYNWEE